MKRKLTVKLVEPGVAQEVTPLIKSLSGVVDLPKNFDYKKEYNKHLENKFGSGTLLQRK